MRKPVFLNIVCFSSHDPHDIFFLNKIDAKYAINRSLIKKLIRCPFEIKLYTWKPFCCEIKPGKDFSNL